MLNAEQLSELRNTPALPNRLIKAMDLDGRTQVEVAAAVGITQPYVSDIAKGNYKKLPLELAQRIAALFGPECTVDDVFPLAPTFVLKEDRRQGSDRRAGERRETEEVTR